MEKLKNFIKSEVTGYTLFEKVFLAAMVLLQVVVYCFTPDSIIGMVCGISGVICVVLTAKGKISSYLFNFIQMITYMFICWGTSLYLEFSEQVFYFIACIFGVILWKRNMHKTSEGAEEVKAKKFSIREWLITIIAVIIGTFSFGYIGALIGSTLSYLDAVTTVLAIIAQILMVLRYREQWAMWIAIDVASLILFVLLGNWAMVAMYVAWSINAFYGWYNWTKLTKYE